MELDELVQETWECPTCGAERKRPGRHWSAASNDCEWPSIDDRLRTVLDALAVAGASADGNESTRLRVWTISRSQAIWLTSELDWLCKSVRTKQNAEAHDQYVVSTMSHPGLNEYRRWAGRGIPPDRVSWSQNFGRVWYSFAGGLVHDDVGSPSMQIKARTNEDRLRRLEHLFLDAGIEVKRGQETLVLSQSPTNELLGQIGPPTPGATYKWALDKQVFDTARIRALSDEPVLEAAMDTGEMCRSLLQLVADVKHLSRSNLTRDAFSGAIASPEPDAIADYLGGGSWTDAVSVAGRWISRPAAESSKQDPGQPEKVPWDLEAAISAIQDAAGKFGEPLVLADYDEWRETNDVAAPAGNTISNKLGWRNTCEKAGVEYVTQGSRGGGRENRYTRSEIKRSVISAAKEVGEPLSKTEYDAWSRQSSEFPHGKTVTNRLGSWGAACELADVTAADQDDRELWTNEDCYQAIRRADADTEGALTVNRYKGWRDETDTLAPSIGTITRRMKWSEAKKHVGTEEDPISRGEAGRPEKWAESEFHDSILEAADSEGTPLSVDKYKSWRETVDREAPAYGTIAHRVGWTDAKEAAGIE